MPPRFPVTLKSERYRPIRTLGAGGEGTAVLAVDEITGARVVLKWRTLADSQREPREYAVLRELHHRNVVCLIDVFFETALGSAVLVEEFLDGLEWQRWITPDINRGQIYELGLLLLDALTYIHAAGVRHGDLKPSNVLLVDDTRGLRPVIIDFGMATAVDARDIPGGTPAYLPPEIGQDAGLGPALDYWALGLLLEQTTRGAQMPGHFEASAYQPSRGDALDGLLVDLLHRDPVARAAAVDRRRKTAAAAGRSGVRFPTEMHFVTRDDDVQQLAGCILDIIDKEPQRPELVVSGPPGSGRDRMMQETLRLLRSRGVRALFFRGMVHPTLFLELVGTETQVRLSQIRGSKGESDSREPAPRDIAWKLARWSESAPLVIFFDAAASASALVTQIAAAWRLLREVLERENPQWNGRLVLVRALTLDVSTPTHGFTSFNLRPFGIDGICAMVHHLFPAARSAPERTARCAEIILRRSSGSLARIEDLLRRAVDEGILAHIEEAWHVDLARLEVLPLPPAGAGAIDDLDGDTKRVFDVLAANGGALHFEAVTQITRWSPRRVEDALDQLVRCGLVRRPPRVEWPLILLGDATGDRSEKDLWLPSVTEAGGLVRFAQVAAALRPWLDSPDACAARFHLERVWADTSEMDVPPSILLLKARVESAENQPERAIKTVESVLERAPRSEEILEAELFMTTLITRTSGRAAVLAFLVRRITLHDTDGAGESDSDLRHRARLAAEAAFHALLLGRNDEGESWARAALVETTPEVHARAYTLLAAALTRRTRFSEAEMAFREAERLWTEQNDERRAAAARANFAVLKMRLGRLAEAAADLESSTRVLEDVGDITQTAAALTNYGVALQRLGRHSAAAGVHTRALILAETSGDGAAAASALASRGLSRKDDGRLVAALRDLRVAVQRHQPVAVDRIEILIKAFYLRTLTLVGRWKTARRISVHLIRRLRTIDAGRERYSVYCALSWLHLAGGRVGPAAAWIRRIPADELQNDPELRRDVEAAAVRVSKRADVNSPALVFGILRADGPLCVLKNVCAARRLPAIEYRFLALVHGVLFRLDQDDTEGAGRLLTKLLRIQSLAEQDMSTREQMVFRALVVQPVFERLLEEMQRRVQGSAAANGPLRDLLVALVTARDAAAGLELFLRVLLSLTPAVRVAYVVPDPESDFRVVAALSRSPRSTHDPAQEISRLVVRDGFSRGETLLVKDAGADDRLGFAPSVQRLGLRSILSVPVRVHGKAAGLIYLDSPLEGGAFSDEHRSQTETLVLLLGLFLGAGPNREARRGKLKEELTSKELELATRTREVMQSRERQGMGVIVGNSPGVREVNELIRKLAPTDLSVLILGETGTGKELVAEALHAASSRRAGPFIAVNCAALPRLLAESELFGHERGAFTGAVRAEPGLFRLAHKGTLFLDEIGELDEPLQAKLLRALETSDVRPVGGKKTFHVDIRVLTATNRDLRQSTTFRKDLYFRLAGVEINLPPLRDRCEDIPLLVRHFVSQLGAEERNFEPAAMRAMVDYRWPGNIRELKNVIDRLTLLVRGRPVLLTDLPKEVSDYAGETPLSLEEAERRAIVNALKFAAGEKKEAARLLGISRSALYDKLARLGPGVAHP